MIGSGVRRLNHVAVTVADMDRALAFWAGALGLELDGRGTVRYAHLDRIVGLDDTEIEWAELRIPGGGIIELFHYHSPAGQPTHHAPNDPGATHVCLEVDGLDTITSSLQQAGYTTRSASPVTIPFGSWKGWRDLYVESPDGVIVELTEPPPTARPESLDPNVGETS